jgi:hypothetical protein
MQYHKYIAEESKKAIKDKGGVSPRGRHAHASKGGKVRHTTYYILNTTYYILNTTYYILHTTYYIRHTTYYIRHTTYYILNTTY